MNDDFTLGIIMQLHGGQDMTRSELVELLRRKSVDPIIVEYIARLYDHKFSKKRSSDSIPMRTMKKVNAYNAVYNEIAKVKRNGKTISLTAAVKEAAKKMDVSERTVWRHLKQKKP